MARRTFVTALAVAGLIATGANTALATPGHAAAAPGRAAAAVSRFDDGSFEYPTAPVGLFQNYAAGQSVGPWTVTSGNVDLIGAGFWQAAEGDQSVDLNGLTAGAVSQTFTTKPGHKYTVSYALAGNTANGPTVKTGRVLVDGQVFQNFSFDITGKSPTAMGYVRRQVTFEATGTTTTLTFASTTPNSANGPVIDDVKVKDCCECASCPDC